MSCEIKPLLCFYNQILFFVDYLLKTLAWFLHKIVFFFLLSFMSTLKYIVNMSHLPSLGYEKYLLSLCSLPFDFSLMFFCKFYAMQFDGA